MARRNRGPRRHGEYLALSALYFDDPDIEPLPWDEKAYFIALGCRVRQLHSDGWISESQAAKIGYPKWKRALPRLTDLGLITRHTDAHGQTAYYLPGYLKWNWSEDAWLRREHQGRIDACKQWHGGPTTCTRPDCSESHSWLIGHPDPMGTPMGDPQGIP